jgi:HEPN domain-containing protein
LVKELWLPLLLAVPWFAFARYEGTKSFYDSAASASWLFFFVFFLQGQLFRMQKNVQDEQVAEEQRVSLREVLGLLRQQGAAQPNDVAPDQPPPVVAEPAEPEPAAPEQPPSVPERDFFGSSRFFAQAEDALRRGLYYPAALTAAVAFEHVLRESAREYGVQERTMRGVIHELAQRSQSDKVEKRLTLLLEMRNKLVHPLTYELPLNEQEARDLVQMFKTGVEWIEFAMTGMHPKYRRHPRPRRPQQP